MLKHGHLYHLRLLQDIYLIVRWRWQHYRHQAPKNKQLMRALDGFMAGGDAEATSRRQQLINALATTLAGPSHIWRRLNEGLGSRPVSAAPQQQQQQQPVSGSKGAKSSVDLGKPGGVAGIGSGSDSSSGLESAALAAALGKLLPQGAIADSNAEGGPPARSLANPVTRRASSTAVTPSSVSLLSKSVARREQLQRSIEGGGLAKVKASNSGGLLSRSTSASNKVAPLPADAAAAAAAADMEWVGGGGGKARSIDASPTPRSSAALGGAHGGVHSGARSRLSKTTSKSIQNDSRLVFRPRGSGAAGTESGTGADPLMPRGSLGYSRRSQEGSAVPGVGPGSDRPSPKAASAASSAAAAAQLADAVMANLTSRFGNITAPEDERAKEQQAAASAFVALARADPLRSHSSNSRPSSAQRLRLANGGASPRPPSALAGRSASGAVVGNSPTSSGSGAQPGLATENSWAQRGPLAHAASAPKAMLSPPLTAPDRFSRASSGNEALQAEASRAEGGTDGAGSAAAAGASGEQRHLMQLMSFAPERPATYAHLASGAVGGANGTGQGNAISTLAAQPPLPQPVCMQRPTSTFPTRRGLRSSSAIRTTAELATLATGTGSLSQAGPGPVAEAEEDAQEQAVGGTRDAAALDRLPDLDSDSGESDSGRVAELAKQKRQALRKRAAPGGVSFGHVLVYELQAEQQQQQHGGAGAGGWTYAAALAQVQQLVAGLCSMVAQMRECIAQVQVSFCGLRCGPRVGRWAQASTCIPRQKHCVNTAYYGSIGRWLPCRCPPLANPSAIVLLPP